MKKLFFILTSLLMAASSAVAEVATATDIAAAGIDTGALMAKGLIVTAGGLCGVFLVLILFFLTIKLMQKIGK